jgi:hypothetical protein
MMRNRNAGVSQRLPVNQPVGRMLAGLLALGGLVLAPGAYAATFSFNVGDEVVDVVSNSTLLGGAAIRTEARDKRLVGKSNNDPNICGRDENGTLYYQLCQGLFREQTFTAERIAGARGMAGSNFDQGNLNYDR